MANPVVSEAEVLSNADDGVYRRLVLKAAAAAPRVRPGHFATLAVGGAGSAMVLRRAFSIHRADPATGTIELVIAERGAGTRELARARVGEKLSLIAPLGTPFPVPDGPGSALLVAEGHGAAPLPALGEEIRRRGGRVGFVLAAADRAGLFGVEQARRITEDVLVLTEDGSAGLAGRITDPVPAVAGAAPSSVLGHAIEAIDADAVYACGPTPLLRAVSEAAAAAGVRCWTAVEEPMACGTGICMACVLPVVGADGVSRLVRSCTDGPVFDGKRVRWADIGTVPADVEGAAAMGEMR